MPDVGVFCFASCIVSFAAYPSNVISIVGNLNASELERIILYKPAPGRRFPCKILCDFKFKIKQKNETSVVGLLQFKFHMSIDIIEHIAYFIILFVR